MTTRQNSMKNVDLIEATLIELGGTEPAAGSEIVIHGVRYRVLEAKPPKVDFSRWRRKPQRDHAQKWKLLVEKVEHLSP
jgi:hypothetical protein